MTFGGFPLSKGDPNPHREHMSTDDRRAHERQRASQDVLHRMHVVRGDGPWREDAMMHGVNGSVEPSLVQGSVHPIEEKVIEVDEEQELPNDLIPTWQWPRVDGSQPDEWPRGGNCREHQKVVHRPTADGWKEEILRTRSAVLNSKALETLGFFPREVRKRERKDSE